MSAFVSYKNVWAKVYDTLMNKGVKDEDAHIISDILLEAEARGYPSQGIMRIFEIGNFLHNKTIMPKGKVAIEDKSQTIRVYNCSKALGYPVALQATEWAIDTAKNFGVGIAGIKGASHIGYLTYYAEKAAKNNCFAIIMTTSSPAVSLPGASSSILGTNPICYAFPLRDQIFCADFSVAEISRGKVIAQAEKGFLFEKPIGYDQKGNPTNDPNEILKGGIAPLANSIKGVLLNMLVGFLAGSLMGGVANHKIRGTRWPDEIPNKGDFILCIDITKICDIESFSANNLDFIEHIKELTTYFHVPGQNSYRKFMEVKENGFQVNDIITQLMDYN